MTTDKARAEAERLGRKLFNEILYDFKYHGATVAIDKATATIAALTSHARPAERELARNQPCGCVVCRCEDEHRCGGCGAKNCGTHPVGQIPNPVYKSSALTARDAEAADKLARVEAALAKWQHEAEGLREAVRVLAEVLDEVQWSVHTRGIGSTCPVCGGFEEEGHYHDCRLLAALDAAGNTNKETL